MHGESETAGGVLTRVTIYIGCKALSNVGKYEALGHIWFAGHGGRCLFRKQAGVWVYQVKKKTGRIQPREGVRNLLDVWFMLGQKCADGLDN